MDNIEIEIQVNVENAQPLATFLEVNGHFEGENHQRDEYFAPPHRDFRSARPLREWFRLRDSSGKYTLNALNFIPIVTVDKARKIWRYKDYEISLDSVQGLSEFLAVISRRSRVRGVIMSASRRPPSRRYNQFMARKRTTNNAPATKGDLRRLIEITKNDIEFLAQGFKRKIDIEEFAALERRVSLLEKRR